MPAYHIESKRDVVPWFTQKFRFSESEKDLKFSATAVSGTTKVNGSVDGNKESQLR
jgi:hypothetical protein